MATAAGDRISKKIKKDLHQTANSIGKIIPWYKNPDFKKMWNYDKILPKNKSEKFSIFHANGPPLEKKSNCLFSTKNTKGDPWKKWIFFFENRKTNDTAFVFRLIWEASENFIAKFEKF